MYCVLEFRKITKGDWSDFCPPEGIVQSRLGFQTVPRKKAGRAPDLRAASRVYISPGLHRNRRMSPDHLDTPDQKRFRLSSSSTECSHAGRVSPDHVDACTLNKPHPARVWTDRRTMTHFQYKVPLASTDLSIHPLWRYHMASPSTEPTARRARCTDE